MYALKDKRVTVVGLGLHGGAVGNVRWLHGQGAKLLVTDLKNEHELASSLEQLRDLPDITYVLGQHREHDFTTADLVLRNPGVPASSTFLIAARKAGIPVEMDSGLFFTLTPTKKIIGITGSKGKSSATNAVAHLMQLVFGHVVTIGIDQTSPLLALSSLTPRDLVVFELSSWRLEALREHHISPPTALVTSLYPDHLDSYDSFTDYVATKKTIMRYQGTRDQVLLNYDDAAVREWSRECPGQLIWFSLGEDIPDHGIFVRRGMVTIQGGRGTIPLFPLARIPSTSEHELRNVLPAIYLAFNAGARVSSIELHVSHLERLKHRLEKVRAARGISYINDSAATIPEATIAALKTLGDQHVVLILGGSDKRLVFDELAHVLCGIRVRALVFLPGSATERMRRVVLSAYASPPPTLDAATMREAVAVATRLAEPGDIVLLSPAATSFGQFKHEFDRGDQFRNEVKSLPSS